MTGSDGGELRFLGLRLHDGRIRGKERGVFSAHAGTITTFAFSPDMSCLATGGGKLGAPGEVRFWRRWTDEKARRTACKPTAEARDACLGEVGASPKASSGRRLAHHSSSFG